MNNTFRQMSILFALIIIDEISLWILLPILAALVAQHSANILGVDNPAIRHFWFGIIMALSPICSMIGAPIWGFISDHIGRKKVLIVSLVGTLLGFLLYAASFSYQILSLLIIGRFLTGITTASQPIVQAVMADISQGQSQHKAVYMGLIACAMTVPLIFAPLIGGYLSDSSMVNWFTYATPFKFISLLALLNLLLLCCFFKDPPRLTLQTRLNAYNLFKTLGIFFQQQLLRQLFIIFIFMELGWALFFQGIPLLLTENLHWNSSQAGNFTAYFSAWMAFALLFLIRPAVRLFTLKKLTLTLLLIAALSLLLSFIFPIMKALWITAVPISIAVGMSYTTLVTQLSDAADAQIQGTLMGMVDAFLALAFAVTGFLAGFLAYLDPKLPLLVAGIFMLISYVTCRYFLTSSSTNTILANLTK